MIGVTDTDLVIVGGGVMGLFTAYYASEFGRRVSIFERGRVGDPATASYGRTRSYRNDYLDPSTSGSPAKRSACGTRSRRARR